MFIIFSILIFSFLIFIHELGHFVAAKLSGVQVNEFSMFMGPAIWKKQKGETLYAIRCIPIGGYCAMEGENQETDNPRSFQKAAWWKRLIILVAGSFMNLVVGILIMLIVYLPAKNIAMPIIDSFEDFSTINSEQGLREGDVIWKMDGERILVQSDFSLILSLNDGDVHDLVVLRDGKKVVLNDFVMQKHTVTDENGYTSELYGVNFVVNTSPTLGDKLAYGWAETLNSARLVRLSLQMLFSGKAGLKDVGGPVMIVDQMTQIANASANWVTALLNMLYIAGFLAINLAIMNMLPFPALDGGRVFFLLVTTAFEAIFKKKVNPKYEGYIHAVGMILLLGLMAVIMFKDVFTIFTR